MVDTFVYPESRLDYQGSKYALTRLPDGAKHLWVHGKTSGFVGGEVGMQGGQLFPLTPANAEELRRRLPWLIPQPLGLRTSAGFGDRIGLATPGHALAAARFPSVAPIFAQQSVREIVRTHRSARLVMDDAMWGLVQAGWRAPWGADADHLKTPDVLPDFVEAGYSFYTVDPGEHVQKVAPDEPLESLRRRAEAVNWSELGLVSYEEIRQAYLGQSFRIDGLTLEFSERDLLSAVVKYAGAVAHAANMYRRIGRLAGNFDFDFEMSVDETDQPTSAHEHFWVARELNRLEVRFVSLAPRFVGAFEKGVDYIGDLALFETELVKHASILKHFGHYKLSLHSGSDKFSIYPLAARWCQGKVHLKTAGTSYLEALRMTASCCPRLFREILEFSRAHYTADKATYHVSAMLERVPASDAVDNSDLPILLDQFDARQVLHVCYGSVLDTFGVDLLDSVRHFEAAYYTTLEKHFKRHLELFAEPGGEWRK